MTILAIDIGNTRTRLARVNDRKVETPVVLPTGEVPRIDEAIKNLFRQSDEKTPLTIAVCSVVPHLTDHVAELARMSLDTEARIIGRNLPLPMKLHLKDTQRVGSDRVAAAAMAFERIGKAVAVASFGTAITIDCVNDDGAFLGGAILPGLQLSAKALEEHTAQLTLVDLIPPETPWGRDTAEAISAGIVFGAAGALREIIERYATELGRWPELIVTGGDGPLMAKYCDFIKAVVPELVLMGIELAYDHARENTEK